MELISTLIKRLLRASLCDDTHFLDVDSHDQISRALVSFLIHLTGRISCVRTNFDYSDYYSPHVYSCRLESGQSSLSKSPESSRRPLETPKSVCRASSNLEAARACAQHLAGYMKEGRLNPDVKAVVSLLRSTNLIEAAHSSSTQLLPDQACKDKVEISFIRCF